jgi:hypothetical protein
MKQDVTAAFYKYLAVILGERTEAAEDAMFTRKVREKRLEVAREEEAMLARRRQAVSLFSNYYCLYYIYIYFNILVWLTNLVYCEQLTHSLQCSILK